ELKQRLSAIKLLALAPSKNLLLEPLYLRPQRRNLAAKLLVFPVKHLLGRHVLILTCLTVLYKPFYRSYHAFLHPFFRSIPLNRSVRASGNSTTLLPVVPRGQLKRPFSKRLAKTHTPLPSQ